jgi:hypothetical protein
MLYQTIEIEVPTEAYQGRPKEFECMGERGEMIMTVVLCDYGTHVQARIGCSPSTEWIAKFGRALPPAEARMYFPNADLKGYK